MKFVDEATIHVLGGDGGRGSLSFRRESHVPQGGPDGGDGGKGGDVIITGSKNLSSLLDFRYKRIYRAENGKNGGGRNKKGKDGRDICIRVPLGTIILDQTDGLPLCDITTDGKTYVVASGGKGGKGNARFATPTHRVPMEFEEGGKGQEKDLQLVLKLLAEVGIVGLPNAGKSTLISRLTEARPKIGDYPFTTLTPTLGVFQDDDTTVVIADIPGIVEGASSGKGLGLTFLKHIERTTTLLWVLDVSSPSPIEDFETLYHEILTYNADLLTKERVMILNKIDLVPAHGLDALQSFFHQRGEVTVKVSGLTGWGIGDLKLLIGERGIQKEGEGS